MYSYTNFLKRKNRQAENDGVWKRYITHVTMYREDAVREWRHMRKERRAYSGCAGACGRHTHICVKERKTEESARRVSRRVVQRASLSLYLSLVGSPTGQCRPSNYLSLFLSFSSSPTVFLVLPALVCLFFLLLLARAFLISLSFVFRPSLALFSSRQSFALSPSLSLLTFIFLVPWCFSPLRGFLPLLSSCLYLLVSFLSLSLSLPAARRAFNPSLRTFVYLCTRLRESFLIPLIEGSRLLTTRCKPFKSDSQKS